MKKKLQKSLPMLVVGIAFVIYVLLWYKQFSYFHYSAEHYYLSDADLASKAAGAAEREFAVDPAYTERIGRIVFWPTQYSDVVIENHTENPVVITLSDHKGCEVPFAPDPVLIAAGEEYDFVAEDRGNYVLTGYGMQAEDASLLEVRYDNHAYMARWKKSVYTLLGLLSAITALSLLFSWIAETRWKKTLPWIALGGGVLAGCCGIGLRLLAWEDWSYTVCRFTSVFLFCLAIAAAGRAAEDPEDPEKVLKPVFNAALSAGIALCVHFVFLSARSSSVFWRFTGTQDSNKRILGYLVVFVVFLLAFWILENCKFQKRILKYVICYFQERVAAYAVIGMLLMLCDTHNDWSVLSLLLLAAAVFGAKHMKKIRIPKAVWWIYYAVVTVAVAANHCVINLWDTGNSADIYHTGTLYHSIYYVANGEPFAGGLRQMYGHFALFYQPLLWVFGNNLQTVGIASALFSGIAVLCLLLFLHRTLKEDFSRLLAGLVVWNCFIISILYLQTFPLRMLWPFVMLLYCTFQKEKKMGVRFRLGGYLLCVLAIVWNMESGLVCSVAWVVCVVARDCKGTKIRDYILRALPEVPIVLAEVLCAYLIVKGYNMLMLEPGERLAELLNWKKEMATLAREEAGDTSNGKLFWGNAPWLGVELVLMGSIAVWVRQLLSLEKKLSGEDTATMFLAVYAAGIFIYWMGRPESYTCIAPYLGALLVIAYEKAATREWDLKKDLSRFGYTVAVFVLSFGIAGYTGHTIEKMRLTKENLVDKKIADYTAVKEYLDYFEREIPDDVYVEVYGAAMINMSLGRDMQNDGLGWGSGMMNLEEKIQDHQWILLSETVEDIPYLRAEKEIVLGTITYVLYENMKYGE